LAPHCLNKITEETIAQRVTTTAEKWECSVCGYVYDPDYGDPEHGIPAGTPFEALPETWVCPACGAAKALFFKKTQ